MALRIGRRLAMVLLLLCAVLAISHDGQLAQTVAQTQAAVTIVVSGLPEGRAARLLEVHRNLDGSFSHVRDLGRLTSGQLTGQIDAGSFVGADPVMISDNERYAAAERFQPAPPDGRLNVRYRHEFNITTIIWSHGVPLARGNGGTISPDPGWYPAGSRVRLVAHPASGLKFLHWGVFGVGEPVDLRTVTATGTELELSLDRPVQVVAAFGA